MRFVTHGPLTGHADTRHWDKSSEKVCNQLNGSSGRTSLGYSSVKEAGNVLERLLQLAPVPEEIAAKARDVEFVSASDLPYFPIPFKETELGAALKAVEASIGLAIAELRRTAPADTTQNSFANQAAERKTENGASRIKIDLERTTAFLFQAYLTSIGGFSKSEKGATQFLKATDLLEAQSDLYRRMSANLYSTKNPGEYYHIHGSLEASSTLRMLGLEAWRPDLTEKGHEAIVEEIESRVSRYTVGELEFLNRLNRQAGVQALKHEEFLKTAHGKANSNLPPWSIDALETTTPPAPFLPTTNPHVSDALQRRPLAGIKVLDVSRIIAAPTIGRILAEYGADVLKINCPHLSDVPFFQLDGNMGKRTAELNLKSAEGRKRFEELLADADVIIEGFRPGAIERLGYGPQMVAKMAEQRGRGYVYVSESCFGHVGEWSSRPGWQQIADCVTGLAWEQGRFLGLDEPVVPPFPISDYGTGCMGAIAALTGLYNRAKSGGSWHCRASLMHYDLLLMGMGQYPDDVKRYLLRGSEGQEKKTENGEAVEIEITNLQTNSNIPEFPQDIRHSHSVDQVSGSALHMMRRHHPEFFAQLPEMMETWHSSGFGAEVVVVQPVAQIEGVELGYSRGSRPNGSDDPTWDGFSGSGRDVKLA